MGENQKQESTFTDNERSIGCSGGKTSAELTKASRSFIHRTALDNRTASCILHLSEETMVVKVPAFASRQYLHRKLNNFRQLTFRAPLLLLVSGSGARKEH